MPDSNATKSDAPASPLVQLGDVWIDNDPREHGLRSVMVTAVCPEGECIHGFVGRRPHAHVVSAPKHTRSTIALARFKATRRDGYTLRHRLGDAGAQRASADKAGQG